MNGGFYPPMLYAVLQTCYRACEERVVPLEIHVYKSFFHRFPYSARSLILCIQEKGGQQGSGARAEIHEITFLSSLPRYTTLTKGTVARSPVPCREPWWPLYKQKIGQNISERA